MSQPLWNLDYQTRTVYGWKGMLEEWSKTLKCPPCVSDVLNNLRVSSHLGAVHDIPLSHFTKFLNNEPAGLTWFLHECVSVSWMWGGTPRTDYLAELVQEVDLDDVFPAFPGSPLNKLTVREFLEKHLSATELDYVNMMPRLVAPTVAATAPVAAAAEVKCSCETLPILIRICRKFTGNTSDDKIYIKKTANDVYSFLYIDGELSHLKPTAYNMSRSAVLKLLSNTLRLLMVDDAPFEGIQLEVPNVPRVLITLENLRSDIRDLVYDTVEATMDNWPVNA